MENPSSPDTQPDDEPAPQHALPSKTPPYPATKPTATFVTAPSSSSAGALKESNALVPTTQGDPRFRAGMARVSSFISREVGRTSARSVSAPLPPQPLKSLPNPTARSALGRHDARQYPKTPGMAAPQRIIPTPPQALTILRAMRIAKDFVDTLPPEQVLKLSTILDDLLQGQTASFRALSHKEFAALDRLVIHLLMIGQRRMRRPLGTGLQPPPPVNNDPDVVFDRRHIMLVLRAMNGLNLATFNTMEKQRIQRTREVIFALSRGRAGPLRLLTESPSEEDRWCCAIITNTLLEAHRALSNTSDPSSSDPSSKEA